MNQTPDSCQDTKFKVINLEDGGLYRFRVIAVNAAGESEAANVKEPVRAQDRFGESPPLGDVLLAHCFNHSFEDEH